MHPKYSLSKLRLIGVLILIASIVLVACNAPLSLVGDEGGENGAESDLPSDEASESELGDGEPVPINCPTLDDHAVLNIDHSIAWGVPSKGRFQLKVQGTQLINFVHSIATYEPDKKVGIYNLSSEPLTVTVNAVEFEDCNTGSAETTMTVSVQGTCFDGVLTLYINEVYAGNSVTMMCGTDKDDPVEIPLLFSSTLQPVTWSLNISEAYSEVQKLSIPMMGVGATGSKNYTLTLAYTP